MLTYSISLILSYSLEMNDACIIMNEINKYEFNLDINNRVYYKFIYKFS